jgi:hypothetical protein
VCNEECLCRLTVRYGTLLTIVLVVVWPALALPVGVFSKGYFTFWTIIAIIWGMVASVAMVFWPILESKDALITTMMNVLHGERVSHEMASATYDPSVKKLPDTSSRPDESIHKKPEAQV